MTWTYLDAYAPAAQSLGVEVIGPTTIALSQDLKLDVEILFCKFGAAIGTFVVDEYEKVQPHKELILKSGYGFSVFGPPRDGEQCTPDQLAEMLSEWGWCGSPDEKPNWLPEWEAYWEAIIARDIDESA